MNSTPHVIKTSRSSTNSLKTKDLRTNPSEKGVFDVEQSSCFHYSIQFKSNKREKGMLIVENGAKGFNPSKSM